MTGQECVLDLLRYIGVTGFAAVANDQALNRPGLDDDDVRRALAAINSGLQTIQKFGPQDLKYGERAAFFNDPMSIQISVIAGEGRSATVSAPDPVPAWLLGCSILIDGDSDLNRISDITGADLSLVRGYRGTNLAGLGAMVYADCVLLEEDIAAVLEPVAASPNLRLFPARDMDEFRRIRQRVWNMGYNRPGWNIGYSLVEAPNPRPGIPGLYAVERRRSGEVFLLLAPMPAQRVNATFQAKLRAERVSESIVDTEDGDDPGYEFDSLQSDQVESLLLPIARWRFFTHPSLKNAEDRGTVKSEYDEVMSSLRQGTVFEVSSHDNRVLYI